METQHIFNVALVGSGGDGVMATGTMLLRTASRMGLWGMMTQSYGPQIRGGEAAAHVSLSASPVVSVGHTKDLLVVFRYSDLPRFTAEVSVRPDTVVVHGPEEDAAPELLQRVQQNVAVPFAELLAGEGLPEIAKNVLCFGVLLRALGWELSHGESCVRELFAKKAPEVTTTNLHALTVGYREGDRLGLKLPHLAPGTGGGRQVLTGNVACARAAISAGCRFYAGYPITPSSEILEEMHRLLPDVGGNCIQAEDEIAALGMVLGASFGGTKAMTATSGPGLSLMTEMLGLSSMAEIPVVVVDCQRAGPSTGMPSRTEQGDLWHALYGGHGDFPRVVLAPTDVADCYRTIFRAVYLAETYQLPALVLSDAYIAQRAEIMAPIDDSAFPRGTRRIAAPTD
ncbi:MAG: 2-oxoacid:acceptor oxidoreductase family protein, partial [Deltaproteobacteria bacterium]|nr:2-oxoacid:acceptor oxidoreductase family protein [Deltaproteobacteria bacterium]